MLILNKIFDKNKERIRIKRYLFIFEERCLFQKKYIAIWILTKCLILSQLLGDICFEREGLDRVRD